MDILLAQYKELLVEKLMLTHSSSDIFRCEHLQQMMDELYQSILLLDETISQQNLENRLITYIYKRYAELRPTPSH